MTRFYTKTGDDGYTGLLGDERTPKYDQRIETIGTIDEANAVIGVARSICISQLTSSILLTTQRDLYHVMTEIATTPANSSRFPKIANDRIIWLETQIDDISKKVDIPNDFIVPGDSKSGATIDLARTIIRRAERQIAHLIHTKLIENHELLQYMNRLSSLFFALELLENQAAGVDTVTLAKE